MLPDSWPSPPDPLGPVRAELASYRQQIAALHQQLFTHRSRLYALEAADLLREAGRTPRQRIEFRSQCGEDSMIWDLVGRKLDGFYIEVGAFDGYHFSTTYALDCMGWSGLLIEAIPERYEECRVRRPSARVVHAALGGRGSCGAATFQVTKDAEGGMASYLNTSPELAKTIENVARHPVTVPLTSMNELLRDHRGEIDAASLDVEGGEAQLLDGFDLERFRPKVLLIEDIRAATNSPVERHMDKEPYTMVGWLKFNRIYIRNDLVNEMAARVR